MWGEEVAVAWLRVMVFDSGRLAMANGFLTSVVHCLCGVCVEGGGVGSA